MPVYEKFDLKAVAKRGENYITGMVDENYDYLPYWYVQINENPAYARHVRVDDAELVASWYEAIVCTIRILGDEADEKAYKVRDGLKRHLMKSWGEKGLRFHEPYLWSNITHASFHEMGWILAGLNRVLEEEPDNAEAEKRASELVRGLRSLVYERKIKTFWSGDYKFEDEIYQFPSDLYIKGEGFVPERISGRGEEAIRNAVLLQPLVVRAERQNDEVALDLAKGIANYTLTMSRYFNYKSEFFGHVHSAVWFAMGLVRLGRFVKNEYYIEKAYRIYSYVKRISSEYGWVPEYAQWAPMSEMHCETCCIRDMIECALELIDCGYDEWELVDKYTRNHLTEQQFTYGGFVAVDNSREDTEDRTWKKLDKRMIGGWSGGGEANSLSISKFRSIAGCCVGTAPQALFAVWDNIIKCVGERVYINLPMECENDAARVEIGYPNEGCMKITFKKDCDAYIRLYGWMCDRVELSVNGKCVPIVNRDGCAYAENVHKSDVLEIRHRLATVEKKEIVQDKEYTVSWRGSDVVKIVPEGEHLRLYQREVGAAKFLPPKFGTGGGEMNMGPTNIKK